MRCAAHPDTETELRCSRCGTPICPRCLVQTPVGARCRSCARVQRSPTYRLDPRFAARGALVALALAGVVGGVCGYLLPHLLRQLGYLALFAGAGYGWLAARAVSGATNGRRGRLLQACAAVSGVLVYIAYNLAAGADAVPRSDLTGYLFVLCAAVVGWSYLR
jgi:hypothetical protein